MAHTLVIFGASGDLTSRKLIPALYRSFCRGRLPEPLQIVGVARSAMESHQWRQQLGEQLASRLGDQWKAESWGEFQERIHYQPGDVQNPDDFRRLGKFLEDLEQEPADRLYYLSTMPQLYAPAVMGLGASGLADDGQGRRNLIIEKPFGIDLPSARQLNRDLHSVFKEDQIYRIDHYLGKETVQNILVLRFGNSIFEPVWNRNYIDHVQITVAEEVAVGRRGAYYDQAGILRDMFQNHLLQLMMIVAMEAPARFNANLVRDEKVKVLQSVRPWHGGDFATAGVRGQYRGYRKEQGVGGESQTETYAVLKFLIDNWRWKDVPFYLRSGKAMSCRTTQIVIQFRRPPHLLFNAQGSCKPEANRLVLQIQPAEGLQLHFQSKVPDAEMRMRMSELDFRFDSGGSGLPDAYERLLQDAISGDASLFARSDEVERAWELIDPIIAAWRSPAAPELLSYEPGLWGPEGARQWMQQEGRQWFDVCPIIR